MRKNAQTVPMRVFTARMDFVGRLLSGAVVLVGDASGFAGRGAQRS